MSQPNDPHAAAARRTAALDNCRAYTLDFVQQHMVELFDRAGTALLDFAERAESNAIQGRFFEAIAHLQHHRDDVIKGMRREVIVGFELGSMAPPRAAPPSDSNELSLLAPEEMEESVASENIIIKTNANCFPELYALSQRFAVVNGGQRLKDFEIPGGPHHLVHAFRRSISILDVDTKIKIILYALFDKDVMRTAQGLYRELNGILKAEGILPNIRPVRLRRPDAGFADPEPEPERAPDETNPPSLGAELFDDILDLMSTRQGRREHGGRPKRPIPTDQVAAAFAKVPPPASAAPPADGGDTAGQQFVDDVKADLSQQREAVRDALDRDQLSPVDADLIDLIGMLFEYMLNDPVLPNSAKALISHLHTPYLKVALIDRQLLVNSDHPARRLLDQMVEAGSLWVEETNPNRGIFPHIQRVVDRVLQEFTDDVGLFDELLRDFVRGVEEQRRRTDTMEQRTQEAARGRERLQLAKQRAAKEVRALVERHALPEPAQAFLHRSWLDVLAFLLLRHAEGTESTAWQDAMATASELVALFDPTLDEADLDERLARLPELQRHITDGVRAMGSYNYSVLEGINGVLADPRGWRARLKSSPPRSSAEAAPSDPLATAPPHGRGTDGGDGEDLSEDERAMIERLRKTRFGTWFEFTSSDDTAPRRIKLSWMSLLTSTCMFVDRSGMQAEIRTLAELAREMLAGRARVIPRQEHPFIERALVSIRKSLTQGEPGAADGGGTSRHG
jgi:hypothetical protein